MKMKTLEKYFKSQGDSVVIVPLIKFKTKARLSERAVLFENYPRSKILNPNEFDEFLGNKFDETMALSVNVRLKVSHLKRLKLSCLKDDTAKSAGEMLINRCWFCT